MMPMPCTIHNLLGCVFLLGSKTKETPKPSDPIGQEQNFGPKESTLGFESKV